MYSLALHKSQKQRKGVAAFNLGSWLEILAYEYLVFKCHSQKYIEEGIELSDVVFRIFE